MATTGYMLKIGWVTKAVIEADTNADVGNFPTQNDMTGGRQWWRPGNKADIIDEGEEILIDVYGGAGAYGGIKFVWPMRYLTPLMIKYIKDTFFSSGTLFSNDVTVRTFNRSSNAWEVYQCTVRREFASSGTAAGGGLDEYELTFVNGVIQAV